MSERIRIRPSALFWGFAQLGVVSFGGAITMARRLLVEKYRWLEPAEFNEVIGLGQVLPGANMVNASVIIGEREGGILGALAAAAGLLLAPLAIVLAVASALAPFAGTAIVRNALHGSALAGAGLVIATGLKMAERLRGDVLGIGFAAASLMLLAVSGWPLPWIIGTLVPLGCVLVVLMRRRLRP